MDRARSHLRSKGITSGRLRGVAAVGFSCLRSRPSSRRTESAQATATCFGEPATTVVTGTILFVGSSADEVIVGDADNSAGAAK
jgi:hypothetical protein